MDEPSPALSLAEQVGRQVRAALAEHRKTQNDLEPVLGMTQASVSRRINGCPCFGADDLIRIAEFLSVDPARFLAPVTIPQQRTTSPTTPTAAGAAA